MLIKYQKKNSKREEKSFRRMVFKTGSNKYHHGQSTEYRGIESLAQTEFYNPFILAIWWCKPLISQP